MNETRHGTAESRNRTLHSAGPSRLQAEAARRQFEVSREHRNSGWPQFMESVETEDRSKFSRMLAPRESNEKGPARILGLVCAAVLCSILVAGLRPFHAPQNDVTWLVGGRGLHFGEYGTILSSGTFKSVWDYGKPTGSLEIWLKPSSVWDNESTMLAFYSPEKTEEFSLHQSYDALTLESDIQAQPRQIRRTTLLVHDVFHQNTSVFVAIAGGPQGTWVWVNGSLAQSAQSFPFVLSGSMIVATSPVANNSWSGDLFGLAIYNNELTQEQILSHYKTWTTAGRPRITESDHTVALYLFDEGHGSIVHNESGAGVDLHIPRHYVILNEKLLEPFWMEFSWDWSYWESDIINIAGFLPLGFFFCAYFASVRKVKRAALATIALGLMVSVLIETLQSFLPTRDSGTTDIITNTLGTCLGTALYWRRPARALLARVLDLIPLATTR